VLKVYGDVPVYKYSSETDLCEYLTLFEGQKFETGDSTLVVLETPGHSDDHICLYLEEEQAIFTGDIILGTGSTVLENYTQYLSSMDKLLSLNAQFLYPAHGEPKVSANKISEDLNHRKQREDQIMGVLEGEMTTKEIAAKVYGNIGEELYKAAENNAKLYLQHLKSLGSVSEINDKWAKHRT
jgi:endoribonuclease LACTB2